ncbi:MAG: peptide-methionine (S)-S-oxide reductase MsrA [Methylibium sp.]|nr:peptide-methionine (S)-S-oxide reductase MsrA [Methylibium sp.]
MRTTLMRRALLVHAALAAGLLIGLTPAVHAQAASAPAASNTAKATFAGGCFWCVESDFDKVEGVLSTTSGYIGGKTTKPTYEQVSTNRTGHAEAVEIAFDPAKVSYEQLLEHYWRSIDPTVKDRQFCDVGHSYRTAIFTHGPAQAQAAQASKEALQKNKPFKEPIVTEIVPATAFYPAETYHQDYYTKNPVRYRYYRTSCGRDARLKQLWGDQAVQH